MRVTRWGNSLAVRIPRAVAEQVRLEEGGEVEMTVEDGRIVVWPRPPTYDLDELVEGITPENRHGETDWGEAEGEVLW